MTAHGESLQLRRPRPVVGALERRQLVGVELLGVGPEEWRLGGHDSSRSMAARARGVAQHPQVAPAEVAQPLLGLGRQRGIEPVPGERHVLPALTGLAPPLDRGDHRLRELRPPRPGSAARGASGSWRPRAIRSRLVVRQREQELRVGADVPQRPRPRRVALGDRGRGPAGVDGLRPRSSAHGQARRSLERPSRERRRRGSIQRRRSERRPPVGTPSRAAAASGASGSVDDQRVVLDAQQRRRARPPFARAKRERGSRASSAAAASRTGLRRSSSAVSSSGSSASDRPVASSRRTPRGPPTSPRRTSTRAARAPRPGRGGAAGRAARARSRRSPSAQTARHRPRRTNAQRGVALGQPAPERPGRGARRPRAAPGRRAAWSSSAGRAPAAAAARARAASSSHSGSSDGNVPSSIIRSRAPGAERPLVGLHRRRRPPRAAPRPPRAPRDGPRRRRAQQPLLGAARGERVRQPGRRPVGHGRRDRPPVGPDQRGGDELVPAHSSARSRISRQPVPSSTRSAPSGVNPKRA